MKPCDPRIKAEVHRYLRYASDPVKRGALAQTMRLRLPYILWTQASWERRIREALNELILEGVPVVSDGRGFRIATSREELEAGLQKKERMAMTLLRAVSRARKIPLNRLVVQLGLFEAEEGAA